MSERRLDMQATTQLHAVANTVVANTLGSAPMVGAAVLVVLDADGNWSIACGARGDGISGTEAAKLLRHVAEAMDEAVLNNAIRSTDVPAPPRTPDGEPN